MSRDRARTSDVPPAPGLLPPTSVRPGDVAMPFRIVGHHQHVAEVGVHTFSCRRETAPTETGLSIRWLAFKDDILLRGDCLTLNDAKRVCRAVGREDQRLQAK